MPHVRITADTMVNRTLVRAGSVVACSEADARLLLRIGKAEKADAPAEAGGAAPKRADRVPRHQHQRGTQ